MLLIRLTGNNRLWLFDDPLTNDEPPTANSDVLEEQMWTILLINANVWYIFAHVAEGFGWMSFVCCVSCVPCLFMIER